MPLPGTCRGPGWMRGTVGPRGPGPPSVRPRPGARPRRRPWVPASGCTSPPAPHWGRGTPVLLGGDLARGHTVAPQHPSCSLPHSPQIPEPCPTGPPVPSPPHPQFPPQCPPAPCLAPTFPVPNVPKSLSPPSPSPLSFVITPPVFPPDPNTPSPPSLSPVSPNPCPPPPPVSPQCPPNPCPPSPRCVSRPLTPHPCPRPGGHCTFKSPSMCLFTALTPLPGLRVPPTPPLLQLAGSDPHSSPTPSRRWAGFTASYWLS